LHSFGNGGEDVVIGVSQDGRSPGSDIVYVLVVIDIPSVGALDTIKDDWISSDALEGTHRRRHSAGHELSKTRDKNEEK
jgi:hypothetical protein